MKKVLAMTIIMSILMLGVAGISVGALDYTEVANEAQFIAAVNAGQNIILIDNIILGTNAQTKNWTPLSYTGELNGNNKSITVYTSTTVAKTGIFSSISGSVKIYDLTIYGTVESTMGKIGALSGELGTTTVSSQIINIKNYANVSCSGANQTYAGGFIGSMESWSGYLGIISNLYNYGSVSISTYSGGIVGINKSSLSLCANFGNVTATTYYAGGIVGRNYDTKTISGCYNSGNISSASFNAGGIVGISAYGSLTINNCYNTGTITSTSGGIVGKSDVTTNINNCYNVGITTNPIYVASTFATASNCYYLSEGLTDDGNAGTNALNFDGMAALGSNKLGAAFASPVNTTYQFAEIIGNLNTSGFVYSDGYTRIYNAEDWAAIANDSDGLYKLENDIVLGSLETSYNPFAFSGTLKGNGHTVTVYINKNSGAASPIGLFTTISGTVIIENLTVNGSIYASAGYVGGIAGDIAATTAGSKLVNCVNNASITTDNINSNSYAGGIFGSMSTWTNAITLSGLINNGIISGYNFVGGIGGMNKIKLINSKNNGNISAIGASGGIIGRAYGNVENSYNSGNLNGAIFGGIIGTSGQNISITNCYNTGDITALSKPAGIIADALSGTVTISNCYNIGKIKNDGSSTDLSYIYYTHANITATNCYYLSVNSEDDSKAGTTAKKLTQFKTFTPTDLGTAFTSPATGATYRFPEIIGNLNTTDFALYEVTSTAGANGTITPSGTQYIKGGTVMNFDLIANEGYMIYGLTYNSSNITVYNDLTSATYKTSAVNADSEIGVSFALRPLADETDLIISVIPTVFVPTLTSNETIINQDGEFSVTIGEKYGVTISTVSDFYGWALIEYGVKLDGIEYPAIITKTAEGKYGILFYGSVVKSGASFKVIPYAKYKENADSLNIITVEGTQTVLDI